MSVKVSIIMPVYNAADYLMASISSMLNQTFSDFELLLYNDGSTDHSEQIIQNFQDKRIQYHKFEKNTGLIHVLNTGLNDAKGIYIARMDADDISAPDRLEKQVLFMDSHPEVGICGTQMEIIDQGLKVKRPCDDESLRWWIFKSSPVAHPSVVLRTSVIRENNLEFDKQAYVAEDFDLWWKMSFHCKMANLPETLLFYRIHPSQESSAKTQVQNENHKKSLIEFMHRVGIDSDKFKPEFVEAMLANDLPLNASSLNLTRAFFIQLLKANDALTFFGQTSIKNKLDTHLDYQVKNIKKFDWGLLVLMNKPEIKSALKRNGIKKVNWVIKSLIFWKTR